MSPTCVLFLVKLGLHHAGPGHSRVCRQAERAARARSGFPGYILNTRTWVFDYERESLL